MIFAQESFETLHSPGCRVSFFVQLKIWVLKFYTKRVIIKLGRFLFYILFFQFFHASGINAARLLCFFLSVNIFQKGE